MSKEKESLDVKSIDDWASERMSADDVEVFENFCRDCGWSADKQVDKVVFDKLLRLHEENKSSF